MKPDVAIDSSPAALDGSSGIRGTALTTLFLSFGFNLLDDAPRDALDHRSSSQHQ